MRATQVCGYGIIPNKTRVDRFADVKGMDIGFTFRKSDEPDGGYNFYTLEHPGMVMRLSFPALFPLKFPSLRILCTSLVQYVLTPSSRSQSTPS